MRKFINKSGTSTLVLNPAWIRQNYPLTIQIIEEEFKRKYPTESGYIKLKELFIDHEKEYEY